MHAALDLATPLERDFGPAALVLPSGIARVRLGEPDQVGVLCGVQDAHAAVGHLKTWPPYNPSEPSRELMLGLPTALGPTALELNFASTPAIEVAANGLFARVDVWRLLGSAVSPSVLKMWEEALVFADLPTVQRVAVQVDLRTDAPAITTRLGRACTPATRGNVAQELDALAAHIQIKPSSRQWLASVLDNLCQLREMELGVELILTASTLREELVVVFPDPPVAAVHAVRASLGLQVPEPRVRSLLKRAGREGTTARNLVVRVAGYGEPTASVEV